MAKAIRITEGTTSIFSAQNSVEFNHRNDIINAIIHSLTGAKEAALARAILRGRTATNIGGDKGNCEDAADWALLGATPVLDTINKVVGDSSIELTSTIASGAFGCHGKSQSFGGSSDWKVDNTKYYFASGYVRNIDADSVSFRILSGSLGSFVGVSPADVTGTSFVRQGIKIHPSSIASDTDIRPYIRGVSSAIGQKVSGDGLMIIEITQGEYDNLTVDELLEKYPYVENTKPTKPTMTKITGKNLIGGNYQGTINGVTVSIVNGKVTLNGTCTSGFHLRLTGGYEQYGFSPLPSSWAQKRFLPKGEYTLSKQNRSGTTSDPSFPALYIYYTDATKTSLYTLNNFIACDSTKDISCIYMYVHTNAVLTNYQFDLMLNHGNTMETYEPYKENASYIALSEPLRSLPGGARDEVTVIDGTLTREVSDDKILPTGGWTYRGKTNDNNYHIISQNLGYTDIADTDSSGYVYTGAFSFSDKSFAAYTAAGFTAIQAGANKKAIAKYYNSTNPTFYFIIPVAEYGQTEDNAGADAYVLANLAGATLNYQLATPVTSAATVRIIEDGAHATAPKSYADGTYIVEPIDQVYGLVDGSNQLTLPGNDELLSLDRVYRNDGTDETPVWVEVTSDCTLDTATRKVTITMPDPAKKYFAVALLKAEESTVPTSDILYECDPGNAQETITLDAGDYTVSIQDDSVAGTITISGGAAGSVSQGSQASFTLGSQADVVFSADQPVKMSQLEAKGYRTYWHKGGETRAGEKITVTLEQNIPQAFGIGLTVKPFWASSDAAARASVGGISRRIVDAQLDNDNWIILFISGTTGIAQASIRISAVSVSALLTGLTWDADDVIKLYLLKEATRFKLLGKKGSDEIIDSGWQAVADDWFGKNTINIGSDSAGVAQLNGLAGNFQLDLEPTEDKATEYLNAAT